MDNQNYLQNIHNKIQTKQRRDNFIGSIGAVAICLIVFFYSPNIQEDFLFDDFYNSIAYYEWEILDEPTSDEILNYLIDYTCIEDYDELMDEELLELINDMNL